jgi:hypothetical protein
VVVKPGLSFETARELISARCDKFGRRLVRASGTPSIDPNDSKIGEIMDVLVDRSGKATALIVGVGGFLGAGEKDVAVPFDAVHATKKGNNDGYLVINSSKDALKNAKGFKYDRNAITWTPEDQARTTTGSGTNNSAPALRPNAR